MVTNSSAAVGWTPMVASKCALVAPACVVSSYYIMSRHIAYYHITLYRVISITTAVGWTPMPGGLGQCLGGPRIRCITVTLSQSLSPAL